jgi:hypothetical protein
LLLLPYGQLTLPGAPHHWWGGRGGLGGELQEAREEASPTSAPIGTCPHLPQLGQAPGLAVLSRRLSTGTVKRTSFSPTQCKNKLMFCCPFKLSPHYIERERESNSCIIPGSSFQDVPLGFFSPHFIQLRSWTWTRKTWTHTCYMNKIIQHEHEQHVKEKVVTVHEFRNNF